jgi:SAM-dependent methyltransferase
LGAVRGALTRAYYAAITERSEQRRIVRFLRDAGATPEWRILDVACGYGRNLEAMRAAGLDAVGVEINPDVAAAVRDKGFTCHLPGDPAIAAERWDAIVMSHIIEYFDHRGLLEFMDGYLAHLRDGGTLVIAAPMLDRAFYEDFDHVKPYNPHAIGQFFGPRGRQVQGHAATELELVDLWFHRRPYLFRFYRSLIVRRASPLRVLLAGANVGFRLLHGATFGLAGLKRDWVGRYRKVG